jgi:peptidyl-tRNA hydrolase
MNFRFHNPNTAEATAEYILKIFIEANKEKVEQAIQAAADVMAAPSSCSDENKANHQ